MSTCLLICVVGGGRALKPTCPFEFHLRVEEGPTRVPRPAQLAVIGDLAGPAESRPGVSKVPGRGEESDGVEERREGCCLRAGDAGPGEFDVFRAGLELGDQVAPAHGLEELGGPPPVFLPASIPEYGVVYAPFLASEVSPDGVEAPVATVSRAYEALWVSQVAESPPCLPSRGRPGLCHRPGLPSLGLAGVAGWRPAWTPCGASCLLRGGLPPDGRLYEGKAGGRVVLLLLRSKCVCVGCLLWLQGTVRSQCGVFRARPGTSIFRRCSRRRTWSLRCRSAPWKARAR